MSNRWEMKIVHRDSGEYAIILEPNVRELSDWIYEQSKELSRKIADEEDKLLLNALPSDSLKKFITLCRQELKRRKGFKL